VSRWRPFIPSEAAGKTKRVARNYLLQYSERIPQKTVSAGKDTMAKQSDHIVALTDIASGNEIGKNEPISVKCEEDPLESAEATKKSKGCRHERIETVGSDITEGSSKVDQ
ncbi:unnamed protein product, partial [Porites evermanni]